MNSSDVAGFGDPRKLKQNFPQFFPNFLCFDFFSVNFSVQPISVDSKSKITEVWKLLRCPGAKDEFFRHKIILVPWNLRSHKLRRHDLVPFLSYL